MYYPHYKTGLRYAFTLQCPNLDHQLTLSLLHDATVHGDIHYYDVCKVADSVNIAYNNDNNRQFYVLRGKLWEYPVRPIKGWYSYIPKNWEIIKPFLDHYSLNPNWIDCNYTWGWLDEETGTWTGAVGKVRNYNL